MYTYRYSAYFISKFFNVTLLNQIIPGATNNYNNLPRKSYKHIAVSVNATNKCLDIVLTSNRPLSPVNYLRGIQLFSKLLATHPGMGSYIVDGRLLVQ